MASLVPLASKARAANGLSWAGIILAALCRNNTHNSERSLAWTCTQASDGSEHWLSNPDGVIIGGIKLLQQRITVKDLCGASVTYQVDCVKHLDFSYCSAARVGQITIVIADGQGTQSCEQKHQRISGKKCLF